METWVERGEAAIHTAWELIAGPPEESDSDGPQMSG